MIGGKPKTTIRKIKSALDKGELTLTNGKGYATIFDIVKAIDGGVLTGKTFPISFQVKLPTNKKHTR